MQKPELRVSIKGAETAIAYKNEHGEVEDISHLVHSVEVEHVVGQLPTVILRMVDVNLEMYAEAGDSQMILVYPVDPNTVEPGDPQLLDIEKFNEE